MFFDLKSFAETPALLMENEVWAYNKLFDISEKIAGMVPTRSLVFLVCSNTPASIAAYVGFINHGIVPVMVDKDLDEELFQNLLEKYLPTYIFAEEAHFDFLDRYTQTLHIAGSVLYDLAEQHPFPLHDDLALLMTTSGSTGSPKLVRQSYDNLKANTASIVKYLDLHEDERAVTNLPLHYVYGLSVLNTHLAVDASVVVTDKTLFDRSFWQLMREKKVTNLSGVPYTYAMLKRLRFFRMDLPALRTLTQAGGKLDPELHAQFAEFAAREGKSFVVMYGAAEATARMGYLPPQDALEKVGAMGVAIPGGRFALIDEVGAEITAVDTVGELVYYGANVTLGYAEGGADLARGDERHGRYETGDLARRDADGYYTIVGRKRRFLKMFGKRTNLQEVEHILRRQFGEVEVACAGVDDHLHIFVTQEALVPAIVPFLSAKLGLHHTALTAKYIAEIPKNASGKTVYRALEQYYDV
ncbi:AMP-binding protein [Selenomonas dianae]|uniref:AMP-dependent synthetase/ligase domain-containing protein n=1 Tax=Selenomonas dianae TaxID=135079 RepID=A0ABN0T3B5_9FIRM|nr:AMP-binding protein [Selenomonas dianae]WLD82056.1 AMP-binding protein [Selenomonas dianae]